ncbi:hypothetical protein BN1097_350044 [Clostridioides difficile]|uniref:Uncharacterized protein n=1 Tax=Clostridioides difficile TaxID=1496 RepID=A0A069A2G2_CLODI|nr:hypothetical protein BN191_470039 [Clostridioides difficile T61]CDS84892.1 hypothetical protein BN1097_350044 [Clostridioides difficile]
MLLQNFILCQKIHLLTDISSRLILNNSKIYYIILIKSLQTSNNKNRLLQYDKFNLKYYFPKNNFIKIETQSRYKPLFRY